MGKFIEKDENGGATVYYLTKNTFAHFENDWGQLFGKYNWKTYRIAEIYYEDDVMLGGKEFIFVLLGFGFRIRHNNPDNKEMKRLTDIAEKLATKPNKEISDE